MQKSLLEDNIATKSVEGFGGKEGLMARNIEEIRERNRIYNRAWRKAHPERKKREADYLRAWRKSNPEKDKARRKRYYEAHKDEMRRKARIHNLIFRRDYPEKKKESDRKYYITKGKAKRLLDIDHLRKYEADRVRRRRRQDPAFHLMSVLRSRIPIALRMNNGHKSARTMELLGCTILELRKHLEKLWSPGMNWDNWGRNGWHIDHIRPISSFDLSDPEQQKKCFHHSNLQPLWAEENRKKSNHYNVPAVPRPTL